MKIVLGMEENKTDYYHHKSDGSLISFLSSTVKESEDVLLHNLCHLKDSMVIVDVLGGELYNKSNDFRKSIGQQVIKIDPFGVTGETGDTFNPLDILFESTCSINDSLRVFVSEFLNKNYAYEKVKNTYEIDGLLYKDLSIDLICGILLYLTAIPEKKFNLSELKNILFSDDIVYNLAVVLDTIGKRIDPEAYQIISSFLQRSDILRNDIVTTTQLYLSQLGSKRIMESIDTTSFDLKAIKRGQPFSIYLILPPSKIKSHGILLRCWISSLIQLLADTEHVYDNKILFLLDSASETGNIPFYQNIELNSKNKNFQLWTFWESLSELQKIFPADWKTILGNCSMIQAFGTQKPIIAHDLAPVMGVSIDELRRVPIDEHLIMIENGEIVAVKNIVR